MRKSIGLAIAAASLAAAAAGLAPGAGASTSATHPHRPAAAVAIVPHQGFPSFGLCSDSGRNQSSGCLRLVNDSTAGGTPILTSPLSHTNSESWGVVLVNIAGCGTHVIGNGAGACPFAFGSGLNSGKNGDPIVKIENVNLNCLGFDSGGFSVGKVTCGNNNTFTTVFVQDHGGFGYISVPVSDQVGSYQWLTRVGSQAQAQPLPFDSVNSQWGVVH